MTTFETTIEKMKEMNPNEVEAFIVLVKGKDLEGGRQSEGINAIYGSEPQLVNLLGNVNEDLMKSYLTATLLASMKEK